MFLIEKKWKTDQLKEIEEFLKTAYALLATKECQIKKNEKNNSFDRKYNLRHDEKLDILRSLTVEDCIDVSPNQDTRYQDCMVFEFIKDVTISCYGEMESVKLYIKQYICEANNRELVVVISFHEEGMYHVF